MSHFHFLATKYTIYHEHNTQCLIGNQSHHYTTTTTNTTTTTTTTTTRPLVFQYSSSLRIVRILSLSHVSISGAQELVTKIPELGSSCSLS